MDTETNISRAQEHLDGLWNKRRDYDWWPSLYIIAAHKAIEYASTDEEKNKIEEMVRTSIRNYLEE